MADACPECSAVLPTARGAGCRECGWQPERAAGRGGVRWVGPARCAVHQGTELDAEETCPVAHAPAFAYVRRFRNETGREDEALLVTRCPYVCSICRGRLSWAGGCDACYGSRTPHERATRTVEGDRWELDGTGHYTRVQRAPLRLATEAEVAGFLAELRRNLANVGRPVPVPTAAELVAPVEMPA